MGNGGRSTSIRVLQIVLHLANMERLVRVRSNDSRSRGRYSLDDHDLQTHLTEGVKIRVSECTELILLLNIVLIFLLYFILWANKIGSSLGTRKRGIVCKIHI